MIVAGSASPLLLSSAGGYNLTNSLRFRSSASAYLNRTPASAGNRKTWTWSGWVKRGALGVYSPLFIAGTTNGQQVGSLAFSSAGGVYDKLELNFGVQGTSTEFWLQTTQVFRDPSAWYHIVCAVDTTQATASNRVKFYVNGTQITALSSYGGYSQYPSQNYNTSVNNTVQHLISRDQVNTAGYFDGYITEVNFIDGQALTPSSFGETSTSTGVWIPKKYTGTYGTNGFYLPFTDNSALTTSSNAGLGKDFSGNANYWTTNNISITSGSTYDSMTDVPTLTSATAANYCVLNPLNPSGGTYSDGNLKWVSATTDGRFALSTFDITSSGKWYCEVTIGAKSGTYWTVGAFGSPITFNPRMQYRSDGATQVNSTAGSTWASFTTGDVIGMAFDSNTNQITFYKNNTSQGTLTATTTGVSYYFGCGSDSSGSTSTYEINFGQRPFAYTPPTGFNRLNTFNLPTPTIGATASTQANKYMDISLYTGTGSSQSITGLNFQPDWTWIKGRSGATDHGLYDAVRGVQKQLESNTTDAETTETTGLTAFNSNGFTVGALAQLNTSTATYVSWNWKANGSGSTNTAGSISSTVSANTSAGFSIVTYTGTGSNATVGHGLGVAPKWVIVKGRNVGSTNWFIYTETQGNTKYLDFSTGTGGTDTSAWNSTSPTSTVFSVGTSYYTNYSATTYVAYCFAQVAGYSAFGSYTGNGSTDGPFIYTGFRPRYFILKNITSAQSWSVQDTSRSPYNVASAVLLPNSSSAELTGTDFIDIVSNGFKIRHSSSGNNNNSGDTYIYMAFAENPFKYANAR